MNLFQKRLIKLSQTTLPAAKPQPRFFSQQKEKEKQKQACPTPRVKPVNLISTLNRAATPKALPLIAKPIQKEDTQWHKRSVSMKMKNATFKEGKRMVCGQMIKYRKGSEIFAFRCIRDSCKFRQLKALKQDHDVETDEEQVIAATKNMFMSLCESLRQELFDSQRETPDNKVMIQDLL